MKIKALFSKLSIKLVSVWDSFYSCIDWTLAGTLLLMLIGYIFIHDLLGGTLFDFNYWDSYTLQTIAWFNGHVGLGQDYSYLELAIYNNDWFVSFPPFPSVLLIPWVLIFGENVPNNIIMILYVMITVTMVYKCIRFFKIRDAYAAFFAVAMVVGTNMMWMSTMGGVWFQAQLTNMMLCMFTIWFALNNKRKTAYICLACAVGCRPFSVVYFLFLLVWFYKKDKEKRIMNNEYVFQKINNENEKADELELTEDSVIIEKADELELTEDSVIIEKADELNNTDIDNFECNVVKHKKKDKLTLFEFITTLLLQWKAWSCVIVAAVCYMLYNYVRFDNPLEFGHNYLPEFVESEYGQFNIVYLKDNLYQLFIRGIKFNSSGQLEFSLFNGFWMYIVNPFFLILFAYIMINVVRYIKDGKLDACRICLIIGFILNIIGLCMHKTLGGWQFGARYTVDLIPFAYLYVLLSKKDTKIHRWEVFIGMFGIMINLYGTMFMNFSER